MKKFCLIHYIFVIAFMYLIFDYNFGMISMSIFCGLSLLISNLGKKFFISASTIVHNIWIITFYSSSKHMDSFCNFDLKFVQYPLGLTLEIIKVSVLGVFCIVSYSTIEKLKLLSKYQESDYDLTAFSDYHSVRPANMSKWIKQFLMAGLAGLIRPKHNRKYSLETKVAAVKAYLSSTYSNQELLQRYQIRNISQLHQ